MRVCRAGAFALWLAAVFVHGAVAQDLRGGELRINQATAGAQAGADVAVFPNGDFVAAWFSQPVAADPSIEVKARRFSADGRAKGGDLLVARIPRASFYSGSPKVAADGAGRFWVVWEMPPATDTGFSRVFGQRFDAADRPLGPRLRFKASEFGQINPDVAMTPDGRAVVVWESFTDRFDFEGVRIADVHFRRLGPNGAFDGPAGLAVSNGETSRVAIRADGSFGIASEVYNGEAFFYDIYLSLFAADGRTLREPFEINSGNTRFAIQVGPAIAAASDGRMFVAWTDRAGDFVPGTESFEHEGVAGQLVAPDGSPIGENVKLNTFKLGVQAGASVAATPSGGFLVAWTSGGNQDGDGFGIFARHLAADGRRLGREIRMNLARQGTQTNVSLALAASGRGAATWGGPDGAGNFDLFARRLAPPEP